jgi:hypothetical protein
MSTYRDGLDTAPYLCWWVFHPLFPNTEEYSIQMSQKAISIAALGAPYIFAKRCTGRKKGGKLWPASRRGDRGRRHGSRRLVTKE